MSCKEILNYNKNKYTLFLHAKSVPRRKLIEKIFGGKLHYFEKPRKKICEKKRTKKS